MTRLLNSNVLSRKRYLFTIALNILCIHFNRTNEPSKGILTFQFQPLLFHVDNLRFPKTSSPRDTLNNSYHIHS